MAKMFYTMGETAQRLGMSPDEVNALVESRQLEEFKDDAGNLIFKVQQVDLLAGDDTDSSIVLGPSDETSEGSAGMIPLADSGELEPLSLAGSDSMPGMLGDDSGTGGLNLSDDSGLEVGFETSPQRYEPGSPNDQTGVNIFDLDDLEQADPSAQTQLTAEITTPDFDMDAAASGSGLYDLTSDSDDSLVGGPDMLEDLSGDEAVAGAGTGGSSALFDPVGSESSMGAPAGAVAMVAVEPYDGVGSGLGAGAAGAAMLVSTAAFLLTLVSMVGGSASELLTQAGIADNAPLIVAGAGGGMLVVFSVIGLLLLRKGG